LGWLLATIFFQSGYYLILSGKLTQGEDAFIVDSIPVPVCKIVREKQLKICRENFEAATDKGYSAIFKQYYIGYKLHLLIGANGCMQIWK